MPAGPLIPCPVCEESGERHLCPVCNGVGVVSREYLAHWTWRAAVREKEKEKEDERVPDTSQE